MRARRLLLPVLSCAALLAPAGARARGRPLAFSPCPSHAGFECGTLERARSTAAARSRGTIGARRHARPSRSSNPRAARRVLDARRRARARPRSRWPRTSPRVMGAGADRPRPARVRPARHRRLRAAAVHGAAARPRAARPPPTRSAAPLQLGPARGLYTTPDSVDDIEAIRAGRRATTSSMIYGVSYGTKVALRSTRPRYPSRVEGLILDSVVRARRTRPVPPLDVRRHAARAERAVLRRRLPRHHDRSRGRAARRSSRGWPSTALSGTRRRRPRPPACACR